MEQNKQALHYTLSNDKVSLRACNVVIPYETKPPTHVGSTSAKARNVKAASTRTYKCEKKMLESLNHLIQHTQNNTHGIS
jgi:hypothetical protein